jgi:hypothetical protein
VAMPLRFSNDSLATIVVIIQFIFHQKHFDANFFNQASDFRMKLMQLSRISNGTQERYPS